MKILATWYPIFEPIKKNLKHFKKNNIHFDFIKKKQSLNEKDLISKISLYDGVICGDDEFTPKVLDKAIKLKVISKWGTGIDSINTIYAQKKKIKVFNVPGAFTISVSEYAFGMLLNLTRGISYLDECIKNKNSWKKYEGSILKSKSIGIIGYGKIGKQISKIAKAFEMKVFVNDIKSEKKKYIKKNKSLKYLTLEKLVTKSDIILLSADLNPKSHHLLKRKYFKIMKKGVIIINIARGALIKEKDLIWALKKKIVKKIGLDVFENEPINKNSFLKKFKNSILSSHNAFNSKETVKYTNSRVIYNLLKGLKKEKIYKNLIL